MPLLRAAIGLLAIFFAYYLGRSAAALHRRREVRSSTIIWALRATVCVAGVLWGYGLDALARVVLALALVSLGAGVRAQLRPPKDPGLVRQMFPEE